MRKASDIKKDLDNIKGTGETWVMESIPFLVEIAKTIKEQKEAIAKEQEPLKALLEMIDEKYKPELGALEEINSEMRNRVMEEYKGTETIRKEGVGMYVFPEKVSFEVTNEAKVPREFLSLDSKKVKEAIKNGMLHIKGLIIGKKRELQVRIK